jgi:hypothetical protein
MTKEDKLIHLYLWVCAVYDKHPALKMQRLSNHHQPLFSDQELVTIYLWGHFQKHAKLRAIYAYTADHWREWFPQLPSYQVFSQRLNYFSDIWKILLEELWPPALAGLTSDAVMDSLPVMLAVRGRSRRAKVGREYADQGYCATKKMYYHGVKIHLRGQRQPGTLPRPQELVITEASRHDLPVLQEVFQVEGSGTWFGDKAYKDAATKEKLAAQGVILCTPDKKKPGQQHYEVGESGLWSRFVSSLRQPIEAFFNWLIAKTDIQDASRVRSANGLQVHCYGKLTFAFFLLKFYP